MGDKHFKRYVGLDVAVWQVYQVGDKHLRRYVGLNVAV